MNDIISRNYSTVTHRSGRGTLSIARCVKRPRSLHVAIYVRGKRVVAHNRYLFPTCLIASNYFTGACQRRWSIHMGVMLEWRVFRSIYQIEEKSYLYNFSICYAIWYSIDEFCYTKEESFVIERWQCTLFFNFRKIAISGLKLSSYFFFIISRNLFEAVTFF